MSLSDRHFYRICDLYINDVLIRWVESIFGNYEGVCVIITRQFNLCLIQVECIDNRNSAEVRETKRLKVPCHKMKQTLLSKSDVS